MPKILIPSLGDVIRLEEDWTFRLFNEHRNDKLQAAAKLYPPFRYRTIPGEWGSMTLEERKEVVSKSGWLYERPAGYTESDFWESDFWTGDWSHEMTFRAETELTIDRYYIRQGHAHFDSVTFRTNCWVSALGDPLFSASRKLKSLRFWAKLADVNKIVAKTV